MKQKMQSPSPMGKTAASMTRQEHDNRTVQPLSHKTKEEGHELEGLLADTTSQNAKGKPNWTCVHTFISSFAAPEY